MIGARREAMSVAFRCLQVADDLQTALLHHDRARLLGDRVRRRERLIIETSSPGFSAFATSSEQETLVVVLDVLDRGHRRALRLPMKANGDSGSGRLLHLRCIFGSMTSQMIAAGLAAIARSKPCACSDDRLDRG
jgi:hypothetical protein